MLSGSAICICLKGNHALVLKQSDEQFRKWLEGQSNTRWPLLYAEALFSSASGVKRFGEKATVHQRPKWDMRGFTFPPHPRGLALFCEVSISRVSSQDCGVTHPRKKSVVTKPEKHSHTWLPFAGLGRCTPKVNMPLRECDMQLSLRLVACLNFFTLERLSSRTPHIRLKKIGIEVSQIRK